MRQATVLGVVTSLCLLASARADIRVPPEKKEPVRFTSKVTIKHGAIKGVDRNVVAKLIVPVSLVHPAEAPRAGAAPAGNAPALNERGALPASYRTWIAGIALSLAAVSLVFVVRGRTTTRTVAATILGGAILLGAFSAVQANAPAPRRPAANVPEREDSAAPANAPAPRPNRDAAPQIVIELAEEGDSVTLLLAE